MRRCVMLLARQRCDGDGAQNGCSSTHNTLARSVSELRKAGVLLRDGEDRRGISTVVPAEYTAACDTQRPV